MGNKFKTDLAVANLLSAISGKGTLTSEDILELKTHLNDTVTNLEKTGLSSEEAFEVAKMRLGNQEELATEFQKVNGVSMLHKEWVFIVFGVAATILLYNLLETIKNILSSMAASGKISTPLAAYFLAGFYLMTIVLAILLFKNGVRLVEFFKEHIFGKNRILVILFAITTGLLTFMPLTYLVGLKPNDESAQSLIDMIYTNRIVELIIRGTIPFAITLAVFFSLNSVDKPIGLNILFVSNNYFYIALLSIGFETVAAMLSRMLFPDKFFAPFIFGVVLLFLLLVFIKYNKDLPGIFQKIVFLLFAPLFIEVGMSIQRIESTWVRSPLFEFALASIIVTLISLITCFFIIIRKR